MEITKENIHLIDISKLKGAEKRRAQGLKNIVKHHFKHGNKAAVGGRQRKLASLDVLLREVLGYDEGSDERKALARNILDALYKKAMKGDVKAAEMLLERAYGKVKIQMDVDGPRREDIAALFPFKDAPEGSGK